VFDGSKLKYTLYIRNGASKKVTLILELQLQTKEVGLTRKAKDKMV
jgi:hypothetical protein